MPSSDGSSNSQDKPQPPSFAHLHPPVGARQQGLGVGRTSRGPMISAEDARQERSKFFTDCQKEYLASINCRLEHHDHKESHVCQPFFDTYKACRAEENKRRLEANAKGNRVW